METRELLEQVKSGKISIEEAESYFKREPFEEMGYAKLDMHREVRSGFPEVIFCSGKADEHLLHIVGKLYEKNGEAAFSVVSPFFTSCLTLISGVLPFHSFFGIP